MARAKRGVWQPKALIAAHQSSDGYINRGASRVWSRAPTAVYACVQKGWLEMSVTGDRARLTPKGREEAQRILKEEAEALTQ